MGIFRSCHVRCNDSKRSISALTTPRAYDLYYRLPPPWPPYGFVIPGATTFSLPDYMGHRITCLCQLWLIVREAMVRYNLPTTPAASHVPLGFAETTLHKLLEWADNLPPDAVRTNQSPHHVLTMQSVPSTPNLIFGDANNTP